MHSLFYTSICGCNPHALFAWLQGTTPGRDVQTLPESFGMLASLHTLLDLSNCKDLSSLPLSFGRLASLHILDLSSCGRLASCRRPLASLHLTCISAHTGPQRLQTRPSVSAAVLWHAGSTADTVPPHYCNSLAALTESDGHLAYIRVLDLTGCDSLQYFPFI
jgi:hypothetical protein